MDKNILKKKLYVFMKRIKKAVIFKNLKLTKNFATQKN